MSDIFVTSVTSIGGGFVGGILIGYFLKKIIKILIFVAGGLVALLLYLQQQQIISFDVGKMEASLTFVFSSITNYFDKMAQIGDISTLGIPLAGGLSAGLAIGFVKG